MQRFGVVAVLAWLTACGPIPAPGPVSITVDPVAVSLQSGEQKTFSATVVGAKDGSVTWSLKESGGGTVDTAGHYTAPRAAGVFHLVATANADPTKSATARVTVTEAPPVTIAISPGTAELGFAQTQQFTASVGGSANTAVHWAVMEGDAGGSVSVAGLYTAPLSAGTYHVVATADADPAQNAVATVTVHSAIVVVPGAAMLNPLQTQPFAVMGADPVTWSVVEGVTGGTIDQAGVYTASPAVGVYHVKATSQTDANVFGYAEITVTLNPQLTVTIDPQTATMNQGALLQLTATVTHATDTSVKWTVREGAAGGSVTSAGAYSSPNVPGTYHVVATSVADPTRAAVAAITVAPVAVTLSPMTATVPAGGTQDFTATVTGTSDPGLNWTAAGGGTVDASGHYTAPAHPTGPVTVTATSTFDSTKSASASITVTPVVVALSAQPSGPVDQGSTFTFAALVTGAADPSISWTASCGTFSGDVWTAPNAPGTCTITATSTLDPAAKASTMVTVRDVQVAITAQPSGNVDQGSAFAFAASVTGSVDTAVIWVASCGTFSGSTWTAPNAPGPCTIGATAAADPNKSAAAIVTVKSVAVSFTAQTTGPVDQGSSFTFTAQVTGSVNTGVTFSASCGSFIGSTWTAPSAAGPCVVTATANADATKTANATVAVRAVTVTITSQPSGTVNQASTFTFAATATGSVDSGVVFSASCGSFNGAVWTAPAAPGPCTITATSHGDPTSKATVQVNVAAVVVTLTTTTAGPLDQLAQFVFAANVTGSIDNGVTWSASCGTMNGSTFTAPNSGGSCTVTATSTWDTSKSASQVVTINGVGVGVSPGVAQVAPNTTHGFVANVTGTLNKSVTWSVDSGGAGGTIGPTGTYLSPGVTGTDTIRATSVADPTQSATALVAVTTTVAVTVSPGTVTLGVGQTQSFAATVTGAGNTSVRWSVQGGAANGAISAAGVYTAPSTPGTYTVVATALADGTSQGTASVTVGSTPQLTVAIAPTSVQLQPSGSRTFSATVSGSANQNVSWVVHEGPAGGTIDGSGVYRAPPVAGLYHVVAMSQADPSREAFATVTVTTGAPVSVGVSPPSVVLAPGAGADFVASVLNAGNPAVTWSASCGAIDGTGHYTAPATGPCTVTAASVIDATKTASASVTVSASVAVAVQPSQMTVAFGDSFAFRPVVQGAVDTSVSWSIVADPGNVGSVDPSTGVYSSAGATAARPFTVNLRATSNADGTTNATAALKVVDSTLHTVSGLVTYGGTRGPGRVYLAVSDSGGAVLGGTSIAGPGAYAVRCLSNTGTLTVKAWMDLDGYARPDFAVFPAGNATINFSGADVTGANIAIADPAPAVPTAVPVIPRPFDQGLAVQFGSLKDSIGADLADHYDVFVSDSPNPGPANNFFSRQVSATSFSVALVTGLTNGASYYAGVRAVSTAGAGPITVAGPVVAGAAPGTFTVSGRVLLPNAPQGPLFIGLQVGSSGPMWGTVIASPGATNSYALTGVPAGTYKLFAFVDRGDDGVITPLDQMAESFVTVSGNLNAGDLSLPGGHASLTVGTTHDLDTVPAPAERWYLNYELSPVDQIPVRVVLLGGPQAVELPLDLGVMWTSGGTALEGRDFYPVSGSPVVGDSYPVAVWYADGTAEVLSGSVTEVLTPVSGLAPAGAGAGLTPTFSWAAPVPPPSTAYTYEVFVVQPPGIDPLWAADRLSASTLSIPYAGPALTGGTTYAFSVRVRDSRGNAATADMGFSP